MLLLLALVGGAWAEEGGTGAGGAGATRASLPPVIPTTLFPWGMCGMEEMEWDGNARGPLVPCSFLDEQWVECEPARLAGQGEEGGANGTDGAREAGCSRFGGHMAHHVEWTEVRCRVVPCIECRGEREFGRRVPCIKYNGHYFLSTLLYSIFLGVLAVDRFCLGYSAIAVGKLMTVGGLGVWWLIDIFLLITGNLLPADDSNWEPYY